MRKRAEDDPKKCLRLAKHWLDALISYHVNKGNKDAAAHYRRVRRLMVDGMPRDPAAPEPDAPTVQLNTMAELNALIRSRLDQN